MWRALSNFYRRHTIVFWLISFISAAIPVYLVMQIGSPQLVNSRGNTDSLNVQIGRDNTGPILHGSPGANVPGRDLIINPPAPERPGMFDRGVAFFRLTRARSQVRAGNVQAALNEFEQAVSHNPVNPVYWAEYADALYRAGNYEGAAHQAQRCIELAVGSTGAVRRPQCLLLRGAALLSLAQFADADEALHHAYLEYQAIGNSYGMAQAANSRGLIRLRSGDPAAARPFFEDALMRARQGGDRALIDAIQRSLQQAR